uniref:Post-GPI attachment to proteins GalNAc transferase 4 n=1 Tax=Ornithorhynchus anatinus TaxID=9258 RepID=F6TMI9_ORNAN
HTTSDSQAHALSTKPWWLRLSWSSLPIQLFLVSIVTFGLLAPLACHRLLYSYFYLRQWHLDRMSQEFLQQNLEEGQAALRYFEELRATNGSAFWTGPPVPRPWLVITIITVDRQPGFHYVLQVASRFHRLLRRCGPRCRGYRLMLCNVERDPDRHRDAKLLANFFPSASRFEEAGEGSPDAPPVNQFEKEKQDYAYCLEKSLQNYDPEHVLLVEDDAIPDEQIFPVLHHLLGVRFSESQLGDTLYLKLYHPERLQHYINPEPMRILEWFGVGMFLGPLLSWVYVRLTGRPGLSWPIVLFFAVFSMGLVELVGRHYLLELRRLAPALYNVMPVTECCTPAMLFSAPSAHRVLSYLAELRCRGGFAKDTALYSLLRVKGERAFVVEPNLVKHVGMYSSLRSNFHPTLL